MDLFICHLKSERRIEANGDCFPLVDSWLQHTWKANTKKLYYSYGMLIIAHQKKQLKHIIVSCPCRLCPQKEERVWYTSSAFLASFLVLLTWHVWSLCTLLCTNQSRAMWLTCDCHVIPHYSELLLLVRAVDALPCQTDAQSHDELYPVHPRKRSMCTRPFPRVRSRVWERD